MAKKLKILDFYCHPGHQYEFFKLNHKFCLLGRRGQKASWGHRYRPKRDNVSILSPNNIGNDFDLIIVRSTIRKKIGKYIDKNTLAIGVMQGVVPWRMPKCVRAVVWNSKSSMIKHKSFYPDKKHFYIPHGFDPNEFRLLNLNRNNRAMSVYHEFRKRSDFLGYKKWKNINNKAKVCDVYGLGNDDIGGKGVARSFEELINIYNTYSIYLNTAMRSAMPRARAEAAMCGMPIISVNDGDIKRYFKHNTNAIITNDKN